MREQESQTKTAAGSAPAPAVTDRAQVELLSIALDEACRQIEALNSEIERLREELEAKDKMISALVRASLEAEET